MLSEERDWQIPPWHGSCGSDGAVLVGLCDSV